jgi:electron transport complex protein RnfE
LAKEPKKPSYLREFYKGIIIENPVFRLVLGTCPTLAVTTAAMNALGMGAAATLVLVCSNIVISLLRNVIPDKVRIAAYITIIAGFVSIVQMFVKAYSPDLDKSLGIYLPLIVVNCIILGRAEMFASKNKVLPSALDGLGMGIGFTLALLVMGSIRELIGAGTLFGFPVTVQFMAPMIIFILPPGGFFVYGMLVAVVNKITIKKGKVPKNQLGCSGCPMATNCSRADQGECGKP